MSEIRGLYPCKNLDPFDAVSVGKFGSQLSAEKLKLQVARYPGSRAGYEGLPRGGGQ